MIPCSIGSDRRTHATRPPNRLAVGALVAIALLAPGQVRAQTPASAEDRALAERLFEDGRKLVQEKRFAEACPKLAESQRLDPGGGTLLNLALCHEEEGKTATAWVELKEALGQARIDGRASREKLAQEHLTALEPRLSRLRVTVEAPVAGLSITRNGKPLPEVAWGIDAPVDPGRYVLVATAPGRAAWTVVVDVGPEHDTKLVTVPPLASAAGPAAAAPSRPASAAPPARVASDEDARATRRIAGVVAAGVGITGLSLGTIFGLRAIADRRDAEDACLPRGCPAHALALDADAQRAATALNIAFGVGLAASVASVVLLVTSRAPTAAVARRSFVGVAVGPAGASARVRW